MYSSVEIKIHHGGNFVQEPVMEYVGGEVETVTMDPDFLSYPHLLKFIKEDRYGKILSLSFKLPHESLRSLQLLNNDKSTLHMGYLASHWGAIDLYVEHGIDEAEVVQNLPLPEPDEIQEDVEVEDDIGVGTQVDNDPGVVSQAENEQVQCSGDEFSDEEADLESSHKDGDSDLERSPQVEADFVDVECRNAENNEEEIQRARVEVDTENAGLGGEKDDVQSEYYDSEDPLSYQSEKEEAEAPFEQTSNAPTSRFKYPSYNPNVESVDLEVGTLYDDGKQFKKAMINYAVYSKRNIHFVRNEPKRVSVACDQPCPFQAHGSWDETFKCFQLKTVTTEHKCNLKYTLRIVSQAWIEERYEDKIRDNPSIGPTELKKHIQSELKLNVGICMVKRAVKAVLKKIDADFQYQFRRIRDYAAECINSNPGTTAVVKTNRTTPDCPCVFQRFYVCFGAVKNGFLEGCRKVIGLDGCFLKGMLKGEILSAVGRDANNQMYPIAWGIVEIENTESWRWFLGLLKADLGITNTSPWTVISDQQKGLTHVIQELFPDAEHRNCARHVHANWSKLHRGKVLKKHFWMCAKATTEPEFQEQLKILGKMDPTAKVDLERYPPRFWCKAFFRTDVKCDIVDNNLCEAFNGTLVKARVKPIIPMLEDIRVGVMRRIAKKIKSVESWTGNYGPLIMKKLNANIHESMGWKVDFNGDDGYEIKKGRQQFKVKLVGRSCSCRAWDLSGIPCPHAICAIFDIGREPHDYIHSCYSKEAYLRTYAHALQPMNGELFWPKTQNEEILAPIPKKMTGRLKRKRTREASEGSSRPKKNTSTTGNATSTSAKKRVSKKGKVMRCSLCKNPGHYKPQCPNRNLGQSREPDIHPGSNSSNQPSQASMNQ